MSSSPGRRAQTNNKYIASTSMSTPSASVSGVSLASGLRPVPVAFSPLFTTLSPPETHSRSRTLHTHYYEPYRFLSSVHVEILAVRSVSIAISERTHCNAALLEELGFGGATQTAGSEGNIVYLLLDATLQRLLPDEGANKSTPARLFKLFYAAKA
ncbi:hypothetical protein CYLTODRAFT_445994 [Cylindrobasidium torrendii FP15055 ss-10]|uniref:Uncharacterized protein n=1 Tax=Cylindrobasidium torrendii FP15055 ss-10 TaxID=1314674 RepID=A0A0D7B2K1_9AGAR|nr:hypothetical protein CYLTODRAFT_445994 [Cylindrobasidium torrendii FP15055 ss-10]